METAAPSAEARRKRRPSRPVRQKMIRVRVSEEEYAALMEKGAAVGGMSQLLRDHLGQTRMRHRDDERQRLALLNRINANLNQRLRGGPYPLQGWRCELSALEDEAPLELPPRASLLKPFTFHNQISDET
jgi:hypothetical protein